jgi:hypothetical protein
LAGFEAAWQGLDKAPYAAHGLTRDIDKAAGANVLAACFYFIGLGLYPPPELLCEAWSCYLRYLEGAGDLEEVFFGHPAKKSGNFARREARDRDHAEVAAEIWLAQRDGFTAKDSAELASKNLKKRGLKSPTPESALKVSKKWRTLYDAGLIEHAVKALEAQPVVRISSTGVVSVQEQPLAGMYAWLQTSASSRRKSLRNPPSLDVAAMAHARGFIERDGGVWALTEAGKKVLKKRKNKA